MIATDFSYDGILLSDLGYVMAHISSGTSTSTSSAGSQLTLNRVPTANGRRYFLASAVYDECFETTIDIIKCDAQEISLEEYAWMMRWLNRAEFQEMIFYADDLEAVFFEGTFNVQKIESNDTLIGFSLNFISNSPFGRLPQESVTFTIDEAGGTYTLTDKSYEIGFLYPDYMEITCGADGDLTLSNSQDGTRTTIITGCTSGEVLTVDGLVATLTSSVRSKILNYFNFKFFRIGNNVKSSDNVITSSLPITVTLKYTPIRKVVL